MQRSKFILASILLIFLLLCVLLPDQALAKSGIRLKEDITMMDASNPPPNQTRENIFYFVVRNVNWAICTEEVKVNAPVFINDPFTDRDGLVAKGHARFLGFKRDLSDPYSSELKFFVKCGKEKRIYFGVETGEDGNGCDFHAFRVRVRICDTGEHCFFCCDDYHLDKPCENPTAFWPELTVHAAAVSQPAGTGEIYGRVTDGTTGRGLRVRIVVRKVGMCVTGGPDNTDTYLGEDHTKLLPLAERGTYKFENLPFGNYEVVARRDGVRQTKSVTINSGTPSAEVNFTF